MFQVSQPRWKTEERSVTPVWAIGPAPLIAVGSCFLIGLGLVTRAFVSSGSTPAAYVLFWSGLSLSFAAACALAFSRPSDARAITALSLVGVATYLPSFLRSPAYSIFAD